MKSLLKKISSNECLKAAEKILQAAFKSNNMGIKYKLFQESNDLKHIAKILWKYEEKIVNGDY